LKKQDCGGNADSFVAIDEGVIPRQAVHQHGSFGEDVGIELCIAECGTDERGRLNPPRSRTPCSPQSPQSDDHGGTRLVQH
jgi:hypothetical protein